MTKDIAIITTGGTIGSVLGEHSVGVDQGGNAVGQVLRAAASGGERELKTVSAFNLNSESIGPEDWLVLIDHVEGVLADGYNKIVITHGTDTLHYTAAVIAGVFSARRAKICLTGSLHVPEHPRSDAPLSLRAAMAAVSHVEMPDGVFVAFRADERNARALILPALDVKPMAFDDMVLGAAFASQVAQFCPSTGLAMIEADVRPSSEALPPLTRVSAEALRGAMDRVGLVKLHPGLTERFLCDAAQGRDLLIMEPYHSGTGPALPSSGLGAYLRGGAQPHIMISQFPDQALPAPYASTVSLQALGAYVYKALQTHVLYVWAIMLLARGDDPGTLIDRLSPWALTR
ncbi:MAG: asparaginase domain-containing protein [Pseudomonadota bacterium]